MKIISGGQTGIDTGSLITGRVLGIETGGTAPQGWRTTSGEKEKFLKSFGLVEAVKPGYPYRTECNVIAADFTLMVYEDGYSAGELLTRSLIVKHKKPSYELYMKDPEVGLLISEAIEAIIHQMNADKAKGFTVNVAGNGEASCPGIMIRSFPILGKIFLPFRDTLHD